MKIAVVGNCQIGPLRKIIELMLGDANLPSLPAVHTMTAAFYPQFQSMTEDCDFIIAQHVGDEYPVAPVRTSVLRQTYGDRLVVWPNIYFNGYAPEYGVIRDPEYLNFRGPLYDYHSDKILLGFLQENSVDETVRAITEVSGMDEARYGQAVARGIAELQRREQDTDIGISDFIEEHFARRRLFLVMNHPSNFLLIELACRILARLGIGRLRRPLEWMVSDLEMSYVFHEESRYVRERFEFQFPATELSRGVKMQPADNVLGCSIGTPALLSARELTEDFFRFYRPHEARLRATPRIKALLGTVG